MTCGVLAYIPIRYIGERSVQTTYTFRSQVNATHGMVCSTSPTSSGKYKIQDKTFPFKMYM